MFGKLNARNSGTVFWVANASNTMLLWRVARGTGRESVDIMAWPWLITNGWLTNIKHADVIRTVFFFPSHLLAAIRSQGTVLQLWWTWLKPCNANYEFSDYTAFLGLPHALTHYINLPLVLPKGRRKCGRRAHTWETALARYSCGGCCVWSVKAVDTRRVFFTLWNEWSNQIVHSVCFFLLVCTLKGLPSDEQVWSLTLIPANHSKLDYN